MRGLRGIELSKFMPKKEDFAQILQSLGMLSQLNPAPTSLFLRVFLCKFKCQPKNIATNFDSLDSQLSLNT